MIQIIYRWKVKAGQEDRFARAWTQGTRVIRSAYKGAHGSVLLRSHRDASEFVGVATWDSLEDAQTFWASEHPDPESFRIVSETGKFVAQEIFDELRDLEI